MSTTIRKACNILLDFLIVILGIIILINVYSCIQIKILNKSYSSFFGYSAFEVKTGSMKPTISPSDVIIVKSEKNPNVNDIITYKNKNDFITHRVVEKSDNNYITKGDANNTRDGAITSDEIVGKVAHVLPKFGIIRKTILNPFVILTLIIATFAVHTLFNKKKILKFSVDKKELEDSTPMKIETSIKEEDTSDLDEEPIEIKQIPEELINEPTNIKTESVNEEDLEKTMIFRKISVDAEELNPPTIVEDSEEEIPEEISEEIENVDEDNNIESILKYLNKRKKKFNNILEKIMYFKEEEISELANILCTTKFKKANEESIKSKLLKIYIDGKYYNLVGNVDVSYDGRNMNSRLKKLITNRSEKLIKSYNGNDKFYSIKVKNIANIFTTILYIEDMFKSDLVLEEKIVKYKETISKYLNNYYKNDKELIEVVKKLLICERTYKSITNKLIDSLKTNTFELEFNELSSKKNVYALKLKHNINFSKIYSDYIIDKTYDEGIVAEDKILVTINILLGKLSKDILSCNTNNYYLLYMPESLYKKSNKLNKVENMLNDEMAKNRVILINKSDAITNNKKTIERMKKQGYRFGLLVSDEDEKINEKTSISLIDYVFVDKSKEKELNLTNTLKNNLEINVIKENINDLIDVSGGA